MIIKAPKDKKMSSPEDVTKIFNAILKTENKVDRDKEHFWVVGLKTSNSILYIELATLGLLNQTPIAPREVFRLAIMKGCHSLIAVHNHPSGDERPSPEDRATMKSLRAAGRILNIEMKDFIIIGNGYWSAAESGYL